MFHALHCAQIQPTTLHPCMFGTVVLDLHCLAEQMFKLQFFVSILFVRHGCQASHVDVAGSPQSVVSLQSRTSHSISIVVKTRTVWSPSQLCTSVAKRRASRIPLCTCIVAMCAFTKHVALTKHVAKESVDVTCPYCGPDLRPGLAPGCGQVFVGLCALLMRMKNSLVARNLHDI